MQTTKKENISKILHLQEGKTEKDVLEALAKSELTMDGAIECMHQVGAATFHFIASNKEINPSLASKFYPLERLFEFYYELATNLKNESK
jgi:hypothetical protein